MLSLCALTAAASGIAANEKNEISPKSTTAVPSPRVKQEPMKNDPTIPRTIDKMETRPTSLNKRMKKPLEMLKVSNIVAKVPQGSRKKTPYTHAAKVSAAMKAPKISKAAKVFVASKVPKNASKTAKASIVLKVPQTKDKASDNPAVQPMVQPRRRRGRQKVRNIVKIPGTDRVEIYCIHGCGCKYETKVFSADRAAWHKALRCINAHESQRCALNKNSTRCYKKKVAESKKKSSAPKRKLSSTTNATHPPKKLSTTTAQKQSQNVVNQALMAQQAAQLQYAQAQQIVAQYPLTGFTGLPYGMVPGTQANMLAAASAQSTFQPQVAGISQRCSHHCRYRRAVAELMLENSRLKQDCARLKGLLNSVSGHLQQTQQLAAATPNLMLQSQTRSQQAGPTIQHPQFIQAAQQQQLLAMQQQQRLMAMQQRQQQHQLYGAALARPHIVSSQTHQNESARQQQQQQRLQQLHQHQQQAQQAQPVTVV